MISLLFCLTISTTYAKAGLALRKLQYINHMRDYTDTTRSFPLASVSTGLHHKYAGNTAIKHVSKEVIKKLLLLH